MTGGPMSDFIEELAGLFQTDDEIIREVWPSMHHKIINEPVKLSAGQWFDLMQIPVIVEWMNANHPTFVEDMYEDMFGIDLMTEEDIRDLLGERLL
jgi:hypothetical protein